MDETLVHWIWSTNFHLVGPLDFHFIARKVFVGGSPELGFFLVRHNAISNQEVDFQEHYVGEIVGSVVTWALDK
jgi:hypothetical protein